MFRVGIRGKKKFEWNYWNFGCNPNSHWWTFWCLLSRPLLLKYFHYCCTHGGENFWYFEGQLALPSLSTDSAKCSFCPYLLVLPHKWPCPVFWTWRTNDNRTTLRGLEGGKTSSLFYLQTLAVRVVEGLQPPTGHAAALLSAVSVDVQNTVNFLASLPSGFILWRIRTGAGFTLDTWLVKKRKKLAVNCESVYFSLLN